jgi:hypothetical protein
MKKIFIIPLILIMNCLLVNSCKKFIDVGNPKNQITTTQVFADSTNANAAILGIYANMINTGYLGFCSGGLTLYPGLSSDELYQTANNTANNEFYVNNITTNNSVNNGFWTAGYKFIYSANACVEGIAASNGISLQTKSELIGEARFIRAFLYFHLVNLYGAVPIVISTDYNTGRLAPRSSPALVYAQIIADLQYAEANMPANQGSNSRPGKFSAAALLAKVYLFQGTYSSAQTEASKVINSGAFSLESDLNNVFLAGSNETIWKLDPDYPGIETEEGNVFVPSSATAIPKYVLTPSLFGSFETGDQRKVKWISVNTVGGAPYPFPYKYKASKNTSPFSEDYVVLRLAEQYLIRAEAEANQTSFSASNTDLNVVRTRAGLPKSLALDKASLLTAIDNERRAELFCEWGNRWYDLKRNNQANTVLSVIKSNWNTNSQLYPIPINEISTNPNLTQNPGY